MITHDPDDCCSKRLSRALRKGELDDAEVWNCPRCGLEWRPKVDGENKHWSPVVIISVFR